jgi:hypothetical protein
VEMVFECTADCTTDKRGTRSAQVEPVSIGACVHCGKTQPMLPPTCPYERAALDLVTRANAYDANEDRTDELEAAKAIIACLTDRNAALRADLANAEVENMIHKTTLGRINHTVADMASAM